MNSSHVTVGTVGISAMAALTTLLTGFHGLDADHAAAAAWIICAVLGGAAMLLAWYLQWKVPSAPPLPFNMRNSGDSPPKDTAP